MTRYHGSPFIAVSQHMKKEASMSKYSYAGWHTTPEECAALLFIECINSGSPNISRQRSLPGRILRKHATKSKCVHSANPTHPCWDDTSVSVALSDGITVIVGRTTLFR